MGFLKALGMIGAGVAAPFTGGASLGLIPAIAGAGGEAISAATQASAQNRGTKIDASLTEEQMNQARQRQFMDSMLAREMEGRAGANDAFKNMQRAEYLNSASGYKPAAGTPSYGFGPKAATEAEKAGAQAMSASSVGRLQKGNPIPEVQNPGAFKIDPSLLNAGFWEKLGGIAGPALSGYSAIAGSQSKPVMNNVEGESLLSRLAALQSPELTDVNDYYGRG